MLRGHSINTYSPIYSTPSLIDINGDQRLDVSFANTAGDIYTLDAESGKVIYHFNAKDEIIASPIFFDVNQDKIKESFWITKKGRFYLINSDGNYLYTSRQSSTDSLEDEIIAKPALVDAKNFHGIYLATMMGKVYCLEKKYGLIKWQYQLPTPPLHKSTPAIFASPLLCPVNDDAIADVIVASVNGIVFCLDGYKGSLLWQLNLNEALQQDIEIKLL